jgi:hypothetical protein
MQEKSSKKEQRDKDLMGESKINSNTVDTDSNTPITILILN